MGSGSHDERRVCDHGLPPGSTLYHCASCCANYSSLTLFDSHRVGGECYELEGVYERDGVYSTFEGHAARQATAERLRIARASRFGRKPA
jgi:hypothetical protein